MHARNSDFLNVAKRLAYYPDSNPKSRPYGLYDHDNVIWLGDLNYRINIADLESIYDKIEGKIVCLSYLCVSNPVQFCEVLSGLNIYGCSMDLFCFQKTI